MGAAVTCSKLEGSLTSLKNRTESRLLEEKMKFFRNVTEGFWIGLHVDSDGCLSWLDGSSTSYNRLWASNKQECSTYSSGACEHCVEISSKDFSWKERDCTDRTGYICRASRVIETAGVIENGRKAAKVVRPAHIHGKRRSAGCEVRKIFDKPKIALTPNQPSLNEPQGGCPWKWDLFNNKVRCCVVCFQLL
uniref:C-type lectin domain-containing protein n=1 Tax=Eptatretus burgeri TaxID=7764 RepID=A0A8C4QTQ4_EPTBU